MNYDVERWNNCDYPSHYHWEASFTTVDEAINYVKQSSDPSNYRVIKVLWSAE